MPKEKTKSAAKKRFQLQKGKGKKIMRKQEGMRHNLGTKSTKTKRSLQKKTLVSKADYKKVRRMLPNL